MGTKQNSYTGMVHAVNAQFYKASYRVTRTGLIQVNFAITSVHCHIFSKKEVSVHGVCFPVNTYRGTLIDEEMFMQNYCDLKRLGRSIYFVVF
jgi:hypothetical protein